MHRLQVLLSEEQPKAIFVARSNYAADADAFAGALEDLSEVETLESERFGTLYLNELDRYEGETHWCGEEITVQLGMDKEGDSSTSEQVAEELWQHEHSWNERIEQFILKQLLPLKNRGWLKQGEAPLTAPEFLSGIRIDSITIEGDGSFAFSYSADTFREHDFVINGTLARGPTDFDLIG